MTAKPLIKLHTLFSGFVLAQPVLYKDICMLSMVINPSVRDLWGIKSEKLVFGNPKWGIALNEVVREVRAALGIVPKVYADLHNLLLYEIGRH